MGLFPLVRASLLVSMILSTEQQAKKKLFKKDILHFSITVTSYKLVTSILLLKRRKEHFFPHM